jgi:hypothetical protein
MLDEIAERLKESFHTLTETDIVQARFFGCGPDCFLERLESLDLITLLHRRLSVLALCSGHVGWCATPGLRLYAVGSPRCLPHLRYVGGKPSSLHPNLVAMHTRRTGLLQPSPCTIIKDQSIGSTEAGSLNSHTGIISLMAIFVRS